MSIQELYELAEAELEGGNVDQELANRALRQANGVRAHARQIYWSLRSEQLREDLAASPHPDRLASELKADAERSGKTLARQRGRAGWLYVGTCYTAFVASFIFSCASLPAFFRDSGHAIRYALLAVVAGAIGTFAFLKSKQDPGPIDPFRDCS